MPNGERLEAHSGLGSNLDDPRSISQKNRGVIPPQTYALQPREQLFHGVAALRLNPVGDGDMYGRVGMLAHTYMLGPRGDSNGCVSFKDYHKFLAAYQRGEVSHLIVVTHGGAASSERGFGRPRLTMPTCATGNALPGRASRSTAAPYQDIRRPTACVRMLFDFAARLFGATRPGLRVIVAPTDVAPI